MGQPAVVMGDKVTGRCPNHMIPGPVGSPVPSPPLPFSAPLSQGLSTTVMIGGRPAAVLGSSGTNTPPHVGLHASDPFLAPALEVGRVLAGSTTVTFDGKPAAKSGSSCTCCAVPGRLVGSASTVLIGG
jgi:uncharacterized Zn-binding protein involved in type VI secretion